MGTKVIRKYGVVLSNIRRAKHGGYKTKLYNVWQKMLRRCDSPNLKQYKDYGGRGISVCNDWKDFVCFRDWAYTNGYSEGLTIERKNNDGNYCPTNCEWVTREIQQNNTRKNRFVTHNGITKTLSQWAKVSGINRNTLHSRMVRGAVLFSLCLLISCTPIGVGNSYCKIANPIWISSDDVFTDETARQILLNNETYKALCGL